MENEPQPLHVVFFPYMAPGHMIPTLDTARLFAFRGVKATIITTPANLPTFTEAIHKNEKTSREPIVHIEVFKFPPAGQTGLPDGCENVNQIKNYDMMMKFIKALKMLKVQLEHYLETTRTYCLVSDIYLPWTIDCAKKYNIPRLVFQGVSYFSLCCEEMVRLHRPYTNAIASDDKSFFIPCLPHEIKMTTSQLPEGLLKDEVAEFDEEMKKVTESEKQSYGVIFNSFYELEPEYSNFYTKELGKRAWHIGPVSLFSVGSSGEEHEILKWLNSKPKESIIYICFGSMARSIAAQLYEIAMGLEASGKAFIWVVKMDEKDIDDDNKDANPNDEEWLPPGFEERMQGKGLIIRGWAPQRKILNHEAIGAFVTHCGWNSTLEAIANGVPMVTWPRAAEQFYNEKLVTEILKIGVPVGAKKWSIMPNVDNIVKRDSIEKALREIIDGENAQERKNRVNMLKEMAWKAIEKDGSSFSNLNALINEIRHYHAC